MTIMPQPKPVATRRADVGVLMSWRHVALVIRRRGSGWVKESS